MADHTVWASLLKTNEYDECAASDIEELVFYMSGLLEQKGLQFEVDAHKMVRKILTYVMLRHSRGRLELMSVPSGSRSVPKEWTEDYEAMWIEYIDAEISPEEWQEKVLEPVFGTDIRIWEAACDGWRMDLLAFMPWWIKRSIEPIAEEEDEEDMDTDKRVSKLDPYLLEHGTAKQRRTALRQG